MTRTIVCCIILTLFFAAGARAEALCFDEAGMEYDINPQILKAIAKVESGFNPRAINWNTNGTYDFGVMQINSNWGYTFGAEWWSTLGDPCTNIKAGAMILATCMKKYGYTWKAIGCYNSQTPGKRNSYAIKVFNQLQRIDRDDRLNASGKLPDGPATTSTDHTEGIENVPPDGKTAEQTSAMQAHPLPSGQQETSAPVTD